jgi:hypothetical protein
MYADDFDEKEKARMEQQAEKKKTKGEEAVGVSCMESENPEIGRETGNGIAKFPTSSIQEGNKGNVCLQCLYVMFELIKGPLSSCLTALIYIMKEFRCVEYKFRTQNNYLSRPFCLK